MKRAGNLWPAILERENLLRAYHLAARGKRGKMDVRRFAADFDQNIDRLRAGMADGSFVVGGFHVFKVYDPKERTIHAARFEERVFHHALMNLCEPVLERQAVCHTYACRRGKGRLRAIAAAERAARRCGWYLKLDIRKYFDSVPHAPLLAGLRRVFKDRTVLAWLERIVRSHETSPGRGLPIGSLTSQHLANFFLSGLDRCCQQQAGVVAYVRYMDDFVCWSADKASLLAAGRAIEAMVGQELGLALKHPPCPQRTGLGMDFLGYRIFPGHTTLSRRSKIRYRRKVRVLGRLDEAGRIGERGLQERLEALTAFCRPVRSWRFRRGVLSTNWSAAIGLQPGESGRQLEQQRDQLPRRQPQQQHPGQPQQQRGLPPGPQLRPAVPIGTPTHGTEPAAVQTSRAGDWQRSDRPRGAGRAGGPARTLRAALAGAGAACLSPRFCHCNDSRSAIPPDL